MKIPALDDAAVRAPMVEPIRTESPTNASRNRAESGSASSCADPLGGISISSTTTTTGKRWNYCPECGMKLELGWKHCPGCGQAIGEAQLALIYWPVPYYPPTQPWYPLPPIWIGQPNTASPLPLPPQPIIYCGTQTIANPVN